MGLLSCIFGFKKNEQSEIRAQLKARINGRSMSVDDLGFLGMYSTSPDGRWTIGWSDSFEKPDGGIRGGRRESGNGKYVLCFESIVAAHGELERPNSPSVANNGSFSIEDWKFGGNLDGRFYVFDKSGKELISRDFQANIISSSISENGQLAICQTAGAYDGDDGNKLTGFDVTQRLELFSISPEGGRAKNYTFDEKTKRFGVILKDIGTFFYSTEGALEDPEGLRSARLNSNDSTIALAEAEIVLKEAQPSSKSLELALSKCTSALEDSNVTSYPGFKARALKLKGLLHEQLGHDEDALSSFASALEIDPKVGVKRRIAALEKKLGRR